MSDEGGSRVEIVPVDRPESALVEEAQYVGGLLPINPYVALLNEVARCEFNIAFYSSQVNRAPSAEELRDEVFDDTLLMWRPGLWRNWRVLLDRERDRQVNVASQAVKLGIADQLVQLRRDHARQLADVVVAGLEKADLDDDVRKAVWTSIREEMLKRAPAGALIQQQPEEKTADVP